MDKKKPSTAPATEPEQAKEAAAVAAEADASRIDETVPGGRYVVDGSTVDANGAPAKK